MGWFAKKFPFFLFRGTKEKGKKKPSTPHPSGPVLLPRDKHPISRKDIDQNALKVLYRLHNHGYKSYLVGGSVRDLLLGRKPKDFDIGTDAQPREIRRLFANSMIIGRRFRIAHIRFRGNRIIEVTTFRKKAEVSATDEGLPTRRDNTFGSPEEDSFRRDITINGLFYNIADFTVLDYVGGLKDLNNSLIRTIGDPKTRFTEDPVRMIRAVRHAVRMDFDIDKDTENAIRQMSGGITLCPPARIHEEFLKDLKSGHMTRVIKLFQEYGIFKALFPCLIRFEDDNDFSIDTPRGHTSINYTVYRCLELLDVLVASGKTLSTPFLFSVPMIPYTLSLVDSASGKGGGKGQDIPRIIQEFLTETLGRVGASRKVMDIMKQLLFMNWKMFSTMERKYIPTNIRKRRLFDEAFQLLGITARAYGYFPNSPWPPGKDDPDPLRRLLRPPKKRGKGKRPHTPGKSKQQTIAI